MPILHNPEKRPLDGDTNKKLKKSVKVEICTLRNQALLCCIYFKFFLKNVVINDIFQKCDRRQNLQCNSVYSIILFLTL